MHATKLKAVGRSVMVAIPPHMRKQLNLSAGSEVQLSIEDGRLILQSPRRAGRLGLAARLAMFTPIVPHSERDTQWDTMAAVGREILAPYDPAELEKLDVIADRNERRAQVQRVKKG